MVSGRIYSFFAGSCLHLYIEEILYFSSELFKIVPLEKIDIQILDKDLVTQDCVDFVTNPSSGGIDVFIGTVRNQTKGKRVVKLDFEAYKPMAISEMRKIAIRACEQWPIEKISMHHRVGTLDIEGIAVVIAVATPHRKASFEACQFCIDTLKETVPIWKKEFFEDGEVWVAAHP